MTPLTTLSKSDCVGVWFPVAEEGAVFNKAGTALDVDPVTGEFRVNLGEAHRGASASRKDGKGCRDVAEFDDDVRVQRRDRGLEIDRVLGRKSGSREDEV